MVSFFTSIQIGETEREREREQNLCNVSGGSHSHRIACGVDLSQCGYLTLRSIQPDLAECGREYFN